MTLLTVVQDVCVVVGVERPTSVFSGIDANRTMQEMLAHANEMAQRIAYNTRDWNKLKRTEVIPGDGIRVAFPLPPDYVRMLVTSNVWRSTDTQAPMRFVPDADEWLRRRNNNTYEGRGEWTIMGGEILIQPVMAVGVSASFVYLKKNCVEFAGGGFGDAFLGDEDRYVLNERLLKLGTIVEWKMNKGSPYAENMGTYQDAIMMEMGFDSPAPILVGRLPISANVQASYPWPVPS